MVTISFVKPCSCRYAICRFRVGDLWSPFLYCFSDYI